MAGNPPSELDGQAIKAKARQDHCRFLSAKSFLERALGGVRINCNTQTEFLAELADGVYLCEAMYRLTGKCECAPAGATPIGSHRQSLQNITRFARACTSVGVHTDYIATLADVQRGNIAKIVSCVLELERITARNPLFRRALEEQESAGTALAASALQALRSPTRATSASSAPTGRPPLHTPVKEPTIRNALPAADVSRSVTITGAGGGAGAAAAATDQASSSNNTATADPRQVVISIASPSAAADASAAPQPRTGRIARPLSQVRRHIGGASGSAPPTTPERATTAAAAAVAAGTSATSPASRGAANMLAGVGGLMGGGLVTALGIQSILDVLGNGGGESREAMEAAASSAAAEGGTPKQGANKLGTDGEDSNTEEEASGDREATGGDNDLVLLSMSIMQEKHKLKLRQENVVLSAQLGKAAAEAEELAAENKELCEALEERTRALDNSKTEVATAKQEAQALVKEAADRAAELEQQLKDAGAVQATLEQRLAAAQAKETQVQAAADASTAAMSASLTERERELRRVEERLQAAEARETEHDAQLATRTAALRELEQQLTDTHSRAQAAAEEAASALASAKRDNEEERQRSRTLTDELARERAAGKRALTLLQDELDSRAAALLALQQQQQDWATREAELRAANTAAARQCEALETKLMNQLAERRQLLTQVDDLQASLAQRTAAAERVPQLEAEAHQWQSKAEAALRNATAAEQRVEELEQASVRASEAHAATRSEVQDLRSRLEAAREAESSAVRRADEAAAAAEAEVAAARAEASQAAADAHNSASAAQAADLTRELEAAQGRVKELEAAVLEARQANKASLALKQRLGGVSASLRTITRGVREGLTQLSADVRESMAVTAADFGQLGEALVRAVASAQKQRSEAIDNFEREQKERRRVFNELQNARGNIRVFARVRPLLGKEMSAGDSTSVTCDPSNNSAVAVESGMRNGVPTIKNFEFDHVFDSASTQEQVYAEVSPFVTSALDGYHSCIFAYGQTGSGKTFTMQGPKANPGVYHRALGQLFETAARRAATHRYSISVSMVEIYNERVRDLLFDTSASDGASSSSAGAGAGAGARASTGRSSNHNHNNNSKSAMLDVRQGPHGVYMPGVTVTKVASLDHVEEVIALGGANRAVGATASNSESSRSHSLVLVTIEGVDIHTNAVSHGRLVLVDLAGSERVSKSGVTGSRMKEAQNINRSLSALGDVISALGSKSSHVPFRNSKLTYLLQDSLSKDNKALMIVQVSPIQESRGETLCSLNFAQRVAAVQMGQARKNGESAEVAKLRSMLSRYREEAVKAKNALAAGVKQAEAAAEAAAQEQVQAALSDAARSRRRAEARLSTALTSNEKELAKACTQLAEAQKAATKHAEEANAASSEAEAAKVQAAEQAKRAKALAVERDAAAAASQHAAAAAALLRRKVEAAEQATHTATKEAKAAKVEAKRVKQALNEEAAKLRVAQDALQAAQLAARRAASAAKAQGSAQSAELSSQLAAAKDRCAQLETAAKQAATKAHAADATSLALQQRVEELQAQLATSSSVAEAKFQDLKSRGLAMVAELKRDVAQASARVQELEAERSAGATASADAAVVRAQLVEARATIAELQRSATAGSPATAMRPRMRRGSEEMNPGERSLAGRSMASSSSSSSSAASSSSSSSLTSLSGVTAPGAMGLQHASEGDPGHQQQQQSQQQQVRSTLSITIDAPATSSKGLLEGDDTAAANPPAVVVASVAVAGEFGVGNPSPVSDADAWTGVNCDGEQDASKQGKTTKAAAVVGILKKGARHNASSGDGAAPVPKSPRKASGSHSRARRHRDTTSRSRRAMTSPMGRVAAGAAGKTRIQASPVGTRRARADSNASATSTSSSGAENKQPAAGTASLRKVTFAATPSPVVAARTSRRSRLTRAAPTPKRRSNRSRHGARRSSLARSGGVPPTASMSGSSTGSSSTSAIAAAASSAASTSTSHRQRRRGEAKASASTSASSGASTAGLGSAARVLTHTGSRRHVAAPARRLQTNSHHLLAHPDHGHVSGDGGAPKGAAGNAGSQKDSSSSHRRWQF